MLRDETIHESEPGRENDAAESNNDGHNDSVATDASSDSGSDSDDEDDEINSLRATQTTAALGEQAISRAMFELRDIEPRLSGQGQYLDQRAVGLSPAELEEVGQRYGNLVDFVSRLERVMNLPPHIPTSTPAAPSRAAATDTVRIRNGHEAK
ncbi:hypothetical protein R3P38DRAFT_3214038 [Favolaschia claudopus]|uniref:Biogenesis of lysosome-related organelles complex 1 subunit 3 n=1 Tax=Favolaschia claudopus TaxID=2862362 RepID=A0AAW0ABY7_9AGAR